jgi:ATP-dependent DNA helicase RecQ
MSEILNILENVLQGKKSTCSGADEIREILRTASDQRLVSQATCTYRVCRSLKDIDNNNGNWSDFLGNLRQCILFFKRNFVISHYIKENIGLLHQEFGILVDDATNEVNAVDNFPNWFNDSQQLQSVYDLEMRRDTHPVIGDGLLYEATGHKNYVSAAQKTMVRACMRMPEGSTLLGCLPTGGGKSLVAQIPAYYETQGGRLGGSINGAGVTIVIVPTVALAIDQANSARKYFNNALDVSHMPWSYYGDMAEEDKKIVREGLLNGTIPLLYTSPEAIINGVFSNIIMESARLGKISRLVVDEVHIVVDWGASFRTEFQLLACFRRKVLRISGNRLKTILLSATLTESTVSILRNLFSEEDNFVEVRSDSLRPEPMFWLFQNPTQEEREEKILEILPLLPRPIIMYVTSPTRAEEWKNKILEKNFTSVVTFTGKTTGNGREDIIDKWNDDKIDIIVATSAFGMGVDKRDIRTVIHCCMPESLNRYYQEVGRGGRDGFPSISILSVVPSIDYNETFNLINKKVLKADTASGRWEGMINHPKERISGDSLWLDTDRRPVRLQEQETGQQSADWNTATLLFLYRKGLVDILDVEYDLERNRHNILVKLKQFDILENKYKLIETLKPLREKDWSLVKKEYEDMKALTNNFDYSCWSEFFTNVYTYTFEKCGGCPACRIEKNSPYNLEGEIYPEIHGEEIYKNERSIVTGILGQLISYENEAFLSYDSSLVNKDKFVGTFNKLLDIGIDNFIIPSTGYLWDGLIGKLPGSKGNCYYVFEEDEIINKHSDYFIYGAAAIFYPSDKAGCDRLYKWTRKYLKRNKNNILIHLASDKLFIQSENAYLKDKIKVYHSAESLINKESEQEDDDLF